MTKQISTDAIIAALRRVARDQLGNVDDTARHIAAMAADRLEQYRQRETEGEQQ